MFLFLLLSTLSARLLLRRALARFFIFGLFRLRAFNAVYRRAVFVMFPLVSHVIDYPRNMRRAEHHHAVARLPVEKLAVGDLVVDEMAAGALELADPAADEFVGRQLRHDVDMIVRSAYLMERCAGRAHDPPSKETVRLGFDHVRQDWAVILDVPCDVQVDFRIGS